jgi:hypothetical protein
MFPSATTSIAPALDSVSAEELGEREGGREG